MQGVINDNVEKITYTALTIFSFFLIILALNLLIFLVTRLFSHEYREGFIGFTDWVLGTLMGVVLGIFNVMLFFAILFPVVGVVFPEWSETVLSWFEDSIIAQDIYDNNLLLILFRDFLL